MRTRSKQKKKTTQKRKPASQPLLARVLDERGRQKELSRDEIDLLKRTVAKGTTDDEFKLFLWVCRKHKLDPLTRQVHCVRRFLKKHHQDESGQWVSGYQMTIQMGIDGYRSLAGRDHSDFGGCDEPEYEMDTQATQLFGTRKVVLPIKATIRLWKKGLEHPVVGVAYWDEYAPKMDSDSSFFWQKMPRHMLAKCAEALAIRKGYPELSDIYTDEEMHQASDDFTPGGRQIEGRGSEAAQQAVVQKRLADYKERNKTAETETEKAEKQQAADDPYLDDYQKREADQLEKARVQAEQDRAAKEKAQKAAAAKEAAAKAHPASTPKPEASKPAPASAKPGPGISPSVIPPAGLGILKMFEVRTGVRGKFGVIWLEGNKLPLFIFDNKELPISSTKTARVFDMLSAEITKGFKCGFVVKGKTHPPKTEGAQSVVSWEAIETTQIGPLEWDRGVQVIRTDREPGKQQAMFEREPGE
jgi:phage recombination protein Bet